MVKLKLNSVVGLIFCFSREQLISEIKIVGAQEDLNGAFPGLNLDINRCKPNVSYVWCLPKDYNQEKHPFTCK